MKKIIGIIVIALTAVFASCSMDKYPHDEIAQKIETYSDAEHIRIGIYSNIKAVTTGAYFNISDFQSDLFDATSYFGNYRGLFYQWALITTDQDLEAMWYGWYSVIAQCNFLIGGIEEMDKSKLTAAQKSSLDLYTGEAHWVRAYCYYNLAINWCQVYEVATANNENSGLPLQTVYAPTADASKYPGRSTLFETFKLIMDDIQVAADKITAATADVNKRFYITKDVVTALRARVALWTKDYATAAANAQSLIAKTADYALTTDNDAFFKLWNNDTATKEIIMMSQMANTNDLGSSTGSLFLYDSNNSGKLQPQYIPTQTVIDLYSNDDIRFKNYFRLERINYEGVGAGDLYVITKYPGNPELKTGSSSNNYMNKGKVFRLAEMYLIAAEALHETGDDATASQLLNDLRKARSASWVETPYTGGMLVDEIREERIKEMVADGVRFTDLKRWGLEMNREAALSQPVPALIFNDETHSLLKISAGDYRFLWAIPKRETDNNRNVKQNPFY